MQRLVSYLGSLGLGFLLAGVLLAAMQPASQRYWVAFLILGAGASGAYVFARRRELAPRFTRRATREGANAFALSVIVAAIVVLLNVITERHARQWDTTASSQYSLSPQTLQILDDLEREVVIVHLDRRGTSAEIRANDLLELYGNASPNLRVDRIDPEAEPERALPYTSPTVPLELGTIWIDTGERQQRATAATEPEVTHALIRALRDETKTIYFTGGHDEKSLSDTDAAGLSVIGERLASSGYETKTLVVARAAAGENESGADTVRIPDDAAALVIAGPRRDFLEHELDALDAFVDAGGGVVLLVDPETQSDAPELVAFAAERGIVLGDDVVVDALAQPPVYPVVQSYGPHPIVASFGNTMSIFALARSVTAAEDPPEGTKLGEIFATADENSWAETSIEELNDRGGPRPDQTLGPIGLAVAATIAAGEESEARMVVVGDSDFVANELTSAPLLNADLFLNMINWVSADEDLISIRPRQPDERRVTMNESQKRNVFFFSLAIIPGIVVITGLSVWWGRR